MKAIIPIMLALASCGPAVTSDSYQKPDVTNRTADMDNCEIKALASAPRAIDSNNIDRNFELRMRLFDACMNQKGYTKT